METKVKFYLHAPNVSTPTPIMMVFNYGYKLNEQGIEKRKYQRLKLAVGWSVHPKDWSQEFQRIPPSSRHPQKIQINGDISKVESKVLESFQYFRFQGIIPSPDQLRLHILSGEPVQLYDVKTPIIEFVENYHADCDFKYNTLKNYKRLVNKLKSFQIEKKTVLFFETMDASIFRSFYRFVAEKPLAYKKRTWSTQTHNTLSDYKKNLRKFFNSAKGKGIKVHPDYVLKEFTPVYLPADAVYLTMDRIQQLINFDLLEVGRPGLQSTKEHLIISCYTALRNSDWGRIGGIIQNGDGIPYLKVRTKKSGKRTVVSLPVYAPLMDIYRRHGNRFPKPTSNQKFNESVKELGKLMGWDEIVKVSVSRAFDKEEDRIEEYPFYELLSSHTGRRSFATNAFKAGVNPKFIMQFTGHKKLTDFFNYIKLTADDDVGIFYEQTKGLFEPTTLPSSEGSHAFSFEYAPPASSLSSEMRKLRPSYSTSAHQVCNDTISGDLPSRTG